MVRWPLRNAVPRPRVIPRPGDEQDGGVRPKLARQQAQPRGPSSRPAPKSACQRALPRVPRCLPAGPRVARLFSFSAAARRRRTRAAIGSGSVQLRRPRAAAGFGTEVRFRPDAFGGLALAEAAAALTASRARLATNRADTLFRVVVSPEVPWAGWTSFGAARRRPP